MLHRLWITGFSRKHGSPFIRLFIPFVGRKSSVIVPSIYQKLPLIRNSGFTLIELIITLTIAGILMAVAVPGLKNFVSSNRLTAQINDLIADINLARSEAIKRNTDAGVCVSSAGTSCTASGNWANGWRAYYICPTDGSDTSCTAGASVTARAHEALTGTNTLVLSPAIDAVVYSKTGLTSSGIVTITLCDPQSQKSRVISISNSGRPSLSEGSCT